MTTLEVAVGVAAAWLAFVAGRASRPQPQVRVPRLLSPQSELRVWLTDRVRFLASQWITYREDLDPWVTTALKRVAAHGVFDLGCGFLDTFVVKELVERVAREAAVHPEDLWKHGSWEELVKAAREDIQGPAEPPSLDRLSFDHPKERSARNRWYESPKAREFWERWLSGEPTERLPQLTAEEKVALEEILAAMKASHPAKAEAALQALASRQA